MSNSPQQPTPPAPSAAPTPSRPTLFEILLLLALVLLAAVVRAYRLDAKSLGLEEIMLATAAHAGGAAGHATLAGPAYLWLMRLVSSVSTAEWALRLPALLASTAGVVALWMLGRRLFGPLAGLLAGFMLALSALHIELGQAALADALLATLSTLLLWSLYRAAQIQAGGSAEQPLRGWLGAWLPVVALAVLSLYSHRFALVPVALGLAVFPLFLRAAGQPGQTPTRGALLRLAGVAAVTALAALPLLFVTAQPAAGPFNLPSPGAVLLAFTTNRANWLFDPLFFTAVSLWWLAGLAWLLWRRTAIGVALALWMLLPLLAVPWLAQRAGVAFTPGQLLFVLPVFLLTAALGMIALARLGTLVAQALLPKYRRVAGAAFALLLAASLLAFVKGASDPVAFVYRKPTQDWRTLAAILATRPGPRDQILLLPGVAEPLRWYLKAEARTVDTGLVDALAQACQASDAVYVAEAAAPRQVSDEEARYLRENFVQAPLPDLLLHYRNCRPGQWYGAGAEAIFALARRSDVAYPATDRAREQFNALAAQAAALAAAPPTPTSEPAIVQPEPTPAATPLPDATPDPATPAAEPFTPPDAETLLAELLQIAPDDAMTQVRLGALAVQQAAPAEDAAAHFQQAIELDPATWLAYGLWANSLGASGEITQALQVLDQGLQALPDSLALQTLQARWQDGPAAGGDEFQAALGVGRDALRERRWEDAIAAAQQASALAPARHEAPLLLGDAYRSLGELAQALRAYQRATELAPYLSFLHSRQAEMLARLGRAEEAAALSLTALAIDQGRWENWFALGRAYVAAALAGDAAPVDEARYLPAEPARAALLAEVVLRHAQALAPPEAEAPARALAEMEAALPRLASTPEAEAAIDYAAMGAAQRNAARAEADQAMQMGRPADALAVYRGLAEVDAEDRASRMGAANALAALGRSDEALAAFEAISAQWPDFPFALIRRGALLEELGQQADALAAYREAVRVAPDNADTHFTLAFALRRAGQRAEAIAAFEAGLAIDPGRESAREALQALQAQP